MAQAGRDQNHEPTLIAVSNADQTTIIPLYADPVTHRLLVQGATSSGTVTSVASADGSITVTNPTTTVDLSVVSAPKLTNARTIGGASFDGTANVTLPSKFIVQGTTDAGLSAAQFLGALGTGIVKNTTTTGVLSIATGADLPAMTATVGGAVPTPPNNTTTFLRGDGTFATPGGGGTVTTVGSADGSITVTNPTTTPDLAVVKAPKLSTARTINGTSFDGTANITVTAAAGTLTGTTLNSTVVTSSITTLGSSASLPGSPTTTTQTPSDNSTKIATTAYVDAAVLGQNFKEAVKYATTGALPASTYSNGASGVGATLTEVGLGAVTVDGSTPSVGDRILVKNQASTFQNGIYTVTIVGNAGVAFVLTRATDANQTTEFKTGDSVFVTAGTANSTTTWAYTGIDSPTIGTDAITYAQVAGQGSFTQGNGIAITGNSIAIDTSVTVDKTTAQTLTNKTLTSPVLTTPTLGVASATTVNKVTLTTPATGSTLTILDGKTAKFDNTLEFAGTDSTVITFQATDTYVGRATTDTLTNKTFDSGSTGNVFKLNGTQVLGVSGTGGTALLQTSPTITTPVINGLATGTGVASAATASTLVTRDANANINVNNTNQGYTTTATAAGTTTLTVGSTYYQLFTGSTTQTVALPVASTLVLGQSYFIVNNSSGIVTVQSSGSNLVYALFGGATGIFTCILTSGTSAASWSASALNNVFAVSGKLGQFNNTLALAGTDAATITFQGSDTYVGRATTDTLTNKRVNKRIGTETSSSTSTPTADTVDQWNVTALAAADAFAAPTGTPVDGQDLVIRIKDNGTARALTWNAIYRASSDLALPSTTIISKTLYLGFRYNAADSKWDLLALLNNI